MDYLTPYEAEAIVQELCEVAIREYGSRDWVKQHEAVYKLNLQSHRNAKAREDEYVMNSMVVLEKVKVLIYNLIVSETWKAKVLPLCLNEIQSLSNIKSYTLIYHEAILCNFIGILFFHSSACLEASDYLIDLVDWCYRKLVKLTTERPLTITSDFTNQINELEFAMAIQSISIIQFISDNLSQLTIFVTLELVEQCDIFCVLVLIMESKPWIKETNSGKMIFEDQHWVKLKDSLKIPKVEAQVWLIFFNLFMNNDVRNKYEINSYRKNNLLRLRKFINETVIDQIPVLQSLLRSLEELGMIGDTLPSKTSAFVMQQLPELQNRIAEGQDWKEIAEFQKQNYLVETEEERKRGVELMMGGIEEYLEEPICAVCGDMAVNRCSKCHTEWYCSRKCQVAGWKKHKEICSLLVSEPNGKESKEKSEKIVEIS